MSTCRIFVQATSNLNVRVADWWRNDMTTTEGTKIDSLTTLYGFSQFISDPNSSPLTLFLQTSLT